VATSFKGWGGSWLNSWGTLTTDPNALVGQTQFSISAFALASGKGMMQGSAAFSFGGTGLLEGGAIPDGYMVGSASFRIAATGSLLQFDIDRVLRPRTNPRIKLRAIIDVKRPLQGAQVSVSAGTLTQKVAKIAAPVSVSVRRALQGSSVAINTGCFVARAGVKARVRGASVPTASGSVCGRAGGRTKLSGGNSAIIAGVFRAHAGGKGYLVGNRAYARASGFDDYTTVKNPTDEELALIAINLLTRKQVGDKLPVIRGSNRLDPSR
jgi:hypothetical protein